MNFLRIPFLTDFIFLKKNVLFVDKYMHLWYFNLIVIPLMAKINAWIDYVIWVLCKKEENAGGLTGSNHHYNEESKHIKLCFHLLWSHRTQTSFCYIFLKLCNFLFCNSLWCRLYIITNTKQIYMWINIYKRRRRMKC